MKLYTLEEIKETFKAIDLEQTLEEWKSKFSHHCAIKPKTNT